MLAYLCFKKSGLLKVSEANSGILLRLARRVLRLAPRKDGQTDMHSK